MKLISIYYLFPPCLPTQDHCIQIYDRASYSMVPILGKSLSDRGSSAHVAEMYIVKWKALNTSEVLLLFAQMVSFHIIR